MEFMGSIDQILFIGIIALYLIFHFIFFSKNRINKAKDEILKEAINYNDMQNYIETKKYEFDNFERAFKFLLGIAAAGLIGLRIGGFLDLLAFVVLAIFFIPGVIFYRTMIKIHTMIVRELYNSKDNKIKVSKKVRLSRGRSKKAQFKNSQVRTGYSSS